MVNTFIKQFDRLATEELVYIVSGSDIKKIREQVPSVILDKCEGIFASSANELWVGGKVIYQREFQVPAGLLTQLRSWVKHSEYLDRRGSHIEYRPGMLNFSTVGRNASLSDRRSYGEWDAEHSERHRIADNIQSNHPNLHVAIGGEISIDIYPAGWDKSQAVAYIKEHHSDLPINFFGDKTSKHGNDYSAVCALGESDRSFTVNNYKVTEKIINAFLEVKDNG
tara:strand:+ start:21 stop:692 length:672 start_codon:yes stop_codon:yes gene_type:complete